jgi:small-conductance mechanosensitive channel
MTGQPGQRLIELLQRLLGDWREVIPALPSGSAGALLELALIALVAILLASTLRRVRGRLPATGLFPRVLGLLHGALKLLAGVTAVVLVARLLPSWLGSGMTWVLLAAAAALGWSTRDVLPDLVAGVVLTLERRIRPGVWISGEDFSGTVESVGPRATWLRDGRGHRVSMPNRKLLNAPLVSDTAVGTEHEITLRMHASDSAARVRQALRDAVLMSPWVPPRPNPLVLRDADDPDLWHVRAHLLEARYASRFEGELLERAEEVLTRGPVNPATSSTPDEQVQQEASSPKE